MIRIYVISLLIHLGVISVLSSIPPDPSLKPNQVEYYIAWMSAAYGADLSAEGRAQLRKLTQEFFPSSRSSAPGCSTVGGVQDIERVMDHARQTCDALVYSQVVPMSNVNQVFSFVRSMCSSEWKFDEYDDLTHEGGLRVFREFYDSNMKDGNWGHYRRHFSMLWPKNCGQYQKIPFTDFPRIMSDMRSAISTVRSMKRRCGRPEDKYREAVRRNFKNKHFKHLPSDPSPQDVRELAWKTEHRSEHHSPFTNANQDWQQLASPRPLRSAVSGVRRSGLRRSNTHVTLGRATSSNQD